MAPAKTTKRFATKSGAPRDIDEYLARLPTDQRAALTKVRRTIRAAAPDAVESISDKLPAFRMDGRSLMYFGAAKAHRAVYGLDTSAPELRSFDTSKGTIRFAPDRPVPAAVVTRLVRARIAEIRGRETNIQARSSQKTLIGSRARG